MRNTFYIFALILFIYAGYKADINDPFSDTLLIIGWVFFIGGAIIERFDKLEKKLNNEKNKDTRTSL